MKKRCIWTRHEGETTVEAKKKALLSARSALDKKAFDVVVLNVSKLTSIADFFVICSGDSRRQVHALMDGIQDALLKKGWRPRSVEGEMVSHWILIDYGDVIVHIFKDSVRMFYDLDKLWADAPRVAVRVLQRPVIRPSSRAARKA